MYPVIAIEQLTKTYASGHPALKRIDLEIRKGEIFALLGPNGAGKTTLISIICGIVNPGGGRVVVDGHDIVQDYRAARSKIGLVPQELFNEGFESVWATVRFSRGLFGKAPDDSFLEKLLRDLSLWDKRNARILELSGGMKRRVMIAKALSHEPSILFLDEPTAALGVKQSGAVLRMVAAARDRGIAVVLVTHNPHHAYLVGDHFTILKLGRQELDAPRSDVTLEELTHQMAGGGELEALSHELGRQ